MENQIISFYNKSLPSYDKESLSESVKTPVKTEELLFQDKKMVMLRNEQISSYIYKYTLYKK